MTTPQERLISDIVLLLAGLPAEAQQVAAEQLIDAYVRLVRHEWPHLPEQEVERSTFLLGFCVAERLREIETTAGRA